MIKLKNQADILGLTESGKRLAHILHELVPKAVAGVTTSELDDLAYEAIKALGDKPAFLGYRPAGSPISYPASLCVSLNEEIVHGLPSKRVLKNGDLVTLDLGLNHDGYFTDMAITVPVGEVSTELKKLINVTRESLALGIKEAKVGNYTGDIGFAVNECVVRNGFKVVRDLAGHGVGFAPHEEPLVPNYGKRGKGVKLKAGMVIAIEPMVAIGSDQISLLPDGFTFVTRDGSISAHFEHTVLITEAGPKILTQ